MEDVYEVDGKCDACGVQLTWENTSPISSYNQLCHKCDNNING